MAKVIVDIPDEMWNTLQIGQYQMGYAEYVARYVEKGKLIPSNATNGDVIKALFPHTCMNVGFNERYGDLWFYYNEEEIKFIQEAEEQVYGKASWGFSKKCLDVLDKHLSEVSE